MSKKIAGYPGWPQITHAEIVSCTKLFNPLRFFKNKEVNQLNKWAKQSGLQWEATADKITLKKWRFFPSSSLYVPKDTPSYLYESIEKGLYESGFDTKLVRTEPRYKFAPITVTSLGVCWVNKEGKVAYTSTNFFPIDLVTK